MNNMISELRRKIYYHAGRYCAERSEPLLQMVFRGTSRPRPYKQLRYGAAVVLFATFFGVSSAKADIIQPTPSLPPIGIYVSAVNQPPVCFVASQVCLTNIVHSNFTGITSNIINGNQVETFHSQLTGQVFAFVNGQVGPSLGNIQLSGPVGVTIFGRPSDMQLGTFNTQMTMLNLSGTFNGLAITIALDPAFNSTGVTSLMPFGSQFQISSFFTVFTQLSINGGPFVPATGGHRVELVPEPASLLLLGTGLAGVGAALRKKHKARKSRDL